MYTAAQIKLLSAKIISKYANSLYDISFVLQILKLGENKLSFDMH